jgi:predicted RNase H-like nuclease (RuvC/YqgF family)
MVILMSNMDERIRELEEEVQALMQEAETQKKVNIDMQEQLRQIRKHLGIPTPGDVWASFKNIP